MNAVESALIAPSTPTSTGANDIGSLDSQDFFRLLISELTNQDPFEPADNQALLNQISSIREIELSSSLSDSLRELTGQQNFAASSSLIGKFVTSLGGADGAALSGVVVGVRFDANGQAILQLGTGGEVPIQSLASVQSVAAAAEGLVGHKIMAVDYQDQSDGEFVEGQVTAVRREDDGSVVLELDGGETVRLQDVIGMAPVVV